MPPPSAGGPLRLLVFGGSQGARVMAESCRRRSSGSSPRCASRLAIVQQARDEDSPRVARRLCASSASTPRSRRSSPTCRRAWRRAISWCRARAPRRSPSCRRSAGPRILVPLPHALDQDQLANAGVLMKAGGAIRLDQAEFTPERLAAEITAARRASRSALAAHGRGRQGRAARIDAADRLADLVLRVAGVIPPSRSTDCDTRGCRQR